MSFQDDCEKVRVALVRAGVTDEALHDVLTRIEETGLQLLATDVGKALQYVETHRRERDEARLRLWEFGGTEQRRWLTLQGFRVDAARLSVRPVSS